MRWILFALSAGSLLAASSAVSHAEDDPRLEKILAHWKKLPADLQSCRLSGRRFVYNSVFQIEKRSEFEIGWEKDGRAIIRLKPVGIPAGTSSQRLTPQGKSFVLKTDLEEIWYIPNRQEVIQVKDNGVEKSAGRFEIRPPTESEQNDSLFSFSSWGWAFFRWGKPFSIEFPVHPALTKIPLELNWEIAREDQKHYWVSGLPRAKESPHARNFSEIELIVNKSNLTILAMKIIDPAGTTETVYCFHERQINPVFAPDAEIFDIHEEQLKFIDPFHKQQLTEPLRAPKPTRSSGLTLLFVDLTT